VSTYTCKMSGKVNTCKGLFTAREADRKRGWALFCSKRCKAIEQEGRTGQHKDFLQRREMSGQESLDEDFAAAMDQQEAGWEGHKNVF